jgi:hypothetical protein
MVDQFHFNIIVSFHCSTCNCTRQEETTISTPVAEPTGSQLFTLSSQQNRKCPICASRIAPEHQLAIRPAGAIESWPSELPWRWNRTQRPPAKQAAKELLRGLASGASNVCETYRNLYHLWCTQNSDLEELRSLFRIPGIEPDGQLSVTEEFKNQVRSSAIAILASLPD